MRFPIRFFTTPAPAVMLAIIVLGCGKKSDLLSPNYSYPPSPYGYPIVNPADSTIGFGHTPLLRISRSPAGEYRYEFSDSGTGFWLVNWDGSQQRRASSIYFGEASWSPDGKSLLYSGQNLTSVPWDGHSLDENSRVELGLASYGDPKWNRAMTKIVMSGGGGGFIVWTAASNQISEIGELGWRQPDWSPDDSMLVFHGHVDQESAVMVSDASGSNARVLVQGLDYLDAPKWSPDGSRIAFVGRFGDEYLGLWTVKPDGTDLTPIPTNGVGVNISWSPSGIEIVYVHYSYSEITCKGGTFANGTIWRVNPTTHVRHQVTFNTGTECP